MKDCDHKQYVHVTDHLCFYLVLVSQSTVFACAVPSEVPEVKCQSYHVNKKMFVNLTWKAIPERSVNGRLLGHVIHYGITNRSQANYWSENVSAIDHHLLIDSLTEPGYYSFYVAGATAAGVGKQSEPCQLKLLSEFPFPCAPCLCISLSPPMIHSF